MDNEWGDPFSYARSREIYMSLILKHTIASTYSGADALDGNVQVEYKSTTAPSINGTYNGISVKPTWQEQLKYLYEDKICKYLYHFFARFEDGKIVELWQLSCTDVLDALVPKLKRKYKSAASKADPRLGATISKTEIHNKGIRLI